ncbi:hypothetical protein HPP92_021437 [Vanilla planifolia]|uniref:Uncharacterized protein n=1 Tax=Vanilla planifolia TaxID=51239 RepID=A0A835UHK1_VANPL|nr:hypothetical protein HPP92_021437 [Vanilla planifolia]
MWSSKMESWVVPFLLGIFIFFLHYPQSPVEARIWLRDQEQMPRRVVQIQKIGSKDMMPLWRSQDYAGVRNRRPIHNTLQP